jgi:hypothetical protein
MERPYRDKTIWLEHKSGEPIPISAWEARMRRMARRIRAWEMASPTNVEFIAVHLTYAPEHQWCPGQISEFIRTVAKHLGKRLLGYAWCAEMQERGVPHYHVVLAVRQGVRIPMPDKEGWWPYGSTRVEKWTKPALYLTRIGEKAYQKLWFPKGMRTYAVVWFEWAAQGESAFLLRLWSLPKWLLRRINQFVAILERALPQRFPGGWWCWKGRWFRSPWRVVMVT